jgi:hypothetical protein
MMHIDLLPHLDEIYIRRYSDDARDTRLDAYPASVVDIPMTLRVASMNFYLTCRRDTDGVWLAFCERRERARLLSVFVAHDAASAQARMNDVLQQAVRKVREVIATLPDPLTRRDAIERMVRSGEARVLLERPMPVSGFVIRLVCLPSLDMLLMVWGLNDDTLRDARLIPHAEWYVMGSRIESLLSERSESQLQSFLIQSIFPHGLPPALLGLPDTVNP